MKAIEGVDFKKHFFVVVLEFVVYSLAGWIYEVGLTSAAFGTFVDRGVFHMPLCPLYGFGAFLVIAIFSRIRIKNSVAIFTIATAATCALEYSTSLLGEYVFHQLWWDYSLWPFNFQGRIALFTTVGFGLACLLLIKLLHPALKNLFGQKIKARTLYAAGGTLLALMTICTVFTFVQ